MAFWGKMNWSELHAAFCRHIINVTVDRENLVGTFPKSCLFVCLFPFFLACLFIRSMKIGVNASTNAKYLKW